MALSVNKLPWSCSSVMNSLLVLDVDVHSSLGQILDHWLSLGWSVHHSNMLGWLQERIINFWLEHILSLIPMLSEFKSSSDSIMIGTTHQVLGSLWPLLTLGKLTSGESSVCGCWKEISLEVSVFLIRDKSPFWAQSSSKWPLYSTVVYIEEW